MKSDATIILFAAFAAVSPASTARAATWYVSPSGSDDADGSSVSAPLATFAAAFGKCASGDEVVAADGTYSFSSPATVPNGVAVRSASGDPDSAILTGGGSSVVFETAGSGDSMNITISGFKFLDCRNTVTGTGGLMESGGGAIRFACPTNAANTASVITNCVFENCHSDTGYGGGVMVAGGTKICNCVFTNCTAMMKGEDGTAAGLGARGGGAVYAVARSASVTISDTRFLDCGCSNGVGVVNCGYYKGANNVTASSAGETWFGANGYSANFYRCAFSNNWSYGSTGCLNFKCRGMTDCIFSGTRTYASKLKDGTAKTPGATVWGAESIGITQVYNSEPSNQQIGFINCVFDGNQTIYPNTTTDTPGVIHYQNSGTSRIRVPLVLSNCEFTANSANGIANSGGIVCLNEQHKLTVQDTVFKGNTVKRSGLKNTATAQIPVFGCLSNNKDILFERCAFEGNRCTGTDGGCLYLGGSSSGGSTRIENCRFVGNSRSMVSGKIRYCGIVGFFNAPKNVTIRGCLFECNTNNCTSSRPDTLVALNASGNTASIGTGCVVESCTFVGNYINFANQDFACGIIHAGGAATIRNNVFVGNTRYGHSISPSVTIGSTTLANGCYTEAMAQYVTYNVEDGDTLRATVADAETGEVTDFHNLTDTTVEFKAAALANGKYIPKLGVWSGAGTVLPWMSTATDLYGNPRLAGGRVDPGCAQRQQTGTRIFLN